jgi:DUF4097 and DUF4098 domain-containing protein YvlB
MRRTSVVAPLLLIGLGALFLARNLYPDLPLVDSLARYWPFILIAWGALRLLEILYWAATAKPLPPQGVSGGEWVLIVLLSLAGTSLHAVHGFSASNWWASNAPFAGVEMFGESFDYSVMADKTLSKTPHIVLDNFRGDARIVGMDTDAIKITGHKSIRSLNQTTADRADRETPVEILGDANRAVIDLHQQRPPGPQRVSATLEITVPKGASIEVHGRRGDLDISDITGAVTIASDNAGVRLRNIGGEARLDLRRSDVVHMSDMKGAVEIKGRGSDIELEDIAGPVTVEGAYDGDIALRRLAKPLHFTGPKTELSIERTPGELHLALGDVNATNIVGPVRVSSRSRDVRIHDFSGNLDVDLERGDLELTTGQLPLGHIHAHSRSGDIHLALPTGAQFTLNATTKHGEITNQVDGPLKLERNGNHTTLRGAVGNGPALELDTERGQITLRKATAGDLKKGEALTKLEQ